MVGCQIIGENISISRTIVAVAWVFYVLDDVFPDVRAIVDS